MSKSKKIVLSLCIAFTTLIAFVIGVICFNHNNKESNVPPAVNDNSNQGETIKPTTYTFDAGKVQVVNGPDDINFSYVPSNASNSEATTIAYEYVYGSTSDEKMVLDLKAINSDDVIISYVYSVTPLDTTSTIESSAIFTPQILEKNGDAIYAYILVTPIDEEVSAEFTTKVEWRFGKAGELVIINGFDNSVTTRAIAKGYQLDQPADIQLDNGYNFMGWYLDADYTIPATFPFNTYGTTLYAKLPNLPTDCLSVASKVVDGTRVYYYQVDNTSASQLSGRIIVPKTYNNGINGLGDVISINDSDTFKNQTGVTSIELPSTIEILGKQAFIDCSNLEKINTENCPNLTLVDDGVFTRCAKLNSVDLSNSKITTIKGFDYSEVKNIALPNTVTSIHPQAFLSSAVKIIDLSHLNITSIPDNAFLNSKVEQVILPNTITSIGVSAFEGCVNLNSINFDSLASLTQIGDNAFKGCLNLEVVDLSYTKLEAINSIIADSGVKTIVLPTGVTTINNDAFKNCESLNNVNFEQLINLNTIGDNAFANSGIKGNIIMPESLNVLGSHAFYGCKNLVSVDLSDCLGLNVELGYTFANCINLTTANIPNNLTYLGQFMFSGCQSLANISLPTSIITLNDGVFQNCSSLESINLEHTNIASISKNVFYQSGLKQVKFPATLKSIDLYAFSGSKISKLDMSECDSITSQGYAFSNCQHLATILFPSEQTTIGKHDFEYCTGLLRLNIPNTITTIMDYAFRGAGMRQVTIPNSVTLIGYCSFQDCISLTEIYNLSKFVIVVGGVNNGFIAQYAQVVHTNINVQSMLETIDGAIYYRTGTALKLLAVEDKNISSITIKDGTTHIETRAFEHCVNLTNINIPNTVIEIGDRAFQYCTNLENIKLSGNLSNISNSVFEGCAKLKEITIPQIVTSIGDSAFSGCASLTSIVIPNSVTAINSKAFMGCSNLSSVTLSTNLKTIGELAFSKCSSLTTIKLPNSLTTINTRAFSQAGITRIILPKNVTTLGDATFADCKDLRSVDMTLCVGLMDINSQLFANCISLVQMLLPTHDMNTLGENAFNGCVNLVNIVLPKFSCIEIGAFDGCDSLETVSMVGTWNIYSNLGKLIGGIDVTNSTTNASNLNSVYKNCYWYSI